LFSSSVKTKVLKNKMEISVSTKYLFYTTRLFGLAPYSIGKNSKGSFTRYNRSIPWTVYSVMLIVLSGKFFNIVCLLKKYVMVQYFLRLFLIFWTKCVSYFCVQLFCLLGLMTAKVFKASSMLPTFIHFIEMKNKK
jgi:ABC-type dipeptide/oligopeptide/nickel transport system permease component